MAYTLHWPNTYSEKERKNSFDNVFDKSEFDYKEKIGSISSLVTLQSDFLYPSAMSAACNEPRFLGCKGNQIDTEFLLKPRVPFALPLVQYPNDTKGKELHERDMCAEPVLNWEKYILDFKSACRIPLGIWKAKRIKPHATKLDSDGNVIKNKNYKKVNKAAEEKKVIIDTRSDGEKTTEDEEEEQQKVTKVDEKKDKEIRTKSKWTSGGVQRLQKFLFSKPDLDLENIEELAKDKFKAKDYNKKEKEILEIRQKLYRKELYEEGKKELPIYCVKKYANQPKLKIEGTWNYLFGGASGACAWHNEEGLGPEKGKSILVGCGTKLRLASIVASKKSILSYKLSSVWEEDLDKVPSNIRLNQEKDELSDQIFQIKTCKNQFLAGVRRGRSIELYNLEGQPSLIHCVPNFLYGAKNYSGFRFYKYPSKNPLLLSFDWNPQNSNEIITLDENNVIQVLDIVSEKTVSGFRGRRESQHSDRMGYYPKILLNQAMGISYSHSTNYLYNWADSCVSLLDKRKTPFEGIYPTTNLFELRTSGSFAWSDQCYFPPTSGVSNTRQLNEYISSLHVSQAENYYYVGTTSRIFMMDLRVPRHPVHIMSHGMKSPATYLDSYHDENYEVLVAGSQRVNETFCAIFDTTHTSCVDRTSCQRKNPILASVPRHLSNSRQYFDNVFKDGTVFGFESDHTRAKEHCYAWSTGLTIMKPYHNFDGNLPGGICIFSGNNYGDIFYQEWDQLSSARKCVGIEDQRIKSFSQKWKESMSKYEVEARKSINKKQNVDCTLLIEENGKEIQCNPMPDNNFDPFEADPLHYLKMEKTYKERMEKLRFFKGTVAQEFLNVWEKEAEDIEIFEEYSGSGEELEVPPDSNSNANRLSTIIEESEGSTSASADHIILDNDITEADMNKLHQEILEIEAQDGYESEDLFADYEPTDEAEREAEDSDIYLEFMKDHQGRIIKGESDTQNEQLLANEMGHLNLVKIESTETEVENFEENQIQRQIVQQIPSLESNQSQFFSHRQRIILPEQIKIEVTDHDETGGERSYEMSQNIELHPYDSMPTPSTSTSSSTTAARRKSLRKSFESTPGF